MKTRLLTRFSGVWLLAVMASLVLGFASSGRPADVLSQSVGRAYISAHDTGSVLEHTDFAAPRTKGIASRIGFPLGKVIFAGPNQAMAITAFLAVSLFLFTTFSCSREFLNLSILKAKHHPPTTI